MDQKKLTRAEIVVRGKVQRAGYRDAVDDIAEELDVTGFVENIKPRDVKIVAEGKRENIKRFIELIKIKRFPINVKDMVVEFKPPSGEFEYFEIKRGDKDDEIGERLDVAGKLLYRSIYLQEASLEKLEKLDHIDSKLDKISEDTGSIKANTSRITVIEANTEGIKNNTSEYKIMHEEITRLKEDMAQVKRALALA